PKSRRTARRPSRARRRKHDRASVGTPSLYGVAAGMPRQTPGLATFSRHHINVEVAGVLAAERDPFAVRREMWIRSLALETRDAARHPTSARHGPNILRVGKGDLRSADGWRAQKARAS